MKLSKVLENDSKVFQTGRCPMDLDRVNLLEPSVQQDPYAYYDWLRSNEPVHWDDGLRAFIVSTDELVRKAALDVKTFSNMGTRDFGARSAGADEAARIRAGTYKTTPLTVQLDRPAHTQYRRIINRALSPERMSDSKPWVDQFVTDFLEKMLVKGGGDFTEDFAIALPFAVITTLLGLPQEMRGKMRVWADSYTAQFKGSISPEQEIECAHHYVEYTRFFARLVEERRAAVNPPDDLVTAVALARLDNGSLVGMTDALSMIEQFVVAGAETTVHALSMGAFTLAQRPDLRAALRGNEAAVEIFAEEILRLFAPGQGIFRKVLKDTVLGGIPIPKGAMVMLRWGAANTDESVYESALEIDVARVNAHRHLTFGHGIHKCQGAPLARIELTSAFKCLAEMIEDFSVDERQGGPIHVQGYLFMGKTYLPVLMTPRLR